MGLHFPIYIRKLGVACGWDMIMYERGHKPIKHIFKGTSQRQKSTPIEIMNRIERRAVIGDFFITNAYFYLTHAFLIHVFLFPSPSPLSFYMHIFVVHMHMFNLHMLF